MDPMMREGKNKIICVKDYLFNSLKNINEKQERDNKRLKLIISSYFGVFNTSKAPLN